MAPAQSPQAATLEKLVSLCKRRGFAFPAADIYGGLNGVYDMGPLGTLLKENIRQAWNLSLRRLDHTIFYIDGSLLGPESMWKASGHVDSFHDPLVECKECQGRFRADDVNLEKACPRCGNQSWGDIREFHMMFKTNLGASVEQSTPAYLRPETAQTIFVNFKNVLTSSRAKIPFGIAQTGKAFRNEITPKQFLFRMREFEQMEIEWFCHCTDTNTYFSFWQEERYNFYKAIGITMDNIRLRTHEANELAHYSTKTSDIEYKFPFGWKELEGVAYRGNYDLSQHIKHSGKDLSVFDENTKESFVPHVIESSVGTDRLFLTALFDAYTQEETPEGPRTVLKFHPCLAPVKVAFLPLSKKLAEPTEKIYKKFKTQGLSVQFDVTGSIGKRYRRQDEIGTPYCITYDFDSVEDNKVTLRHRDSMKQERIDINQIDTYLQHLTPDFQDQ